MVLRAVVAAEDLKVVVTTGFVSHVGYIPDGFTHRAVLDVKADEVTVDDTSYSVLPCSALGVMPNEVDVQRLLPPARGEVVVKKSSRVVLGLKADASTLRPVEDLRIPGHGVVKPEGILAELRGEDSDPRARLVSFEVCGGTVFGFVPKSDLLGAPSKLYGSNARCPDTDDGYALAHGHLVDFISCPHEVAVFMRSSTLEDSVGVLKPHARFRVDGGEANGTTLVTIDSPPARPFDGFSFSVRKSDLEGCTPS
jgi:hypothetical protein